MCLSVTKARSSSCSSRIEGAAPPRSMLSAGGGVFKLILVNVFYNNREAYPFRVFNTITNWDAINYKMNRSPFAASNKFSQGEDPVSNAPS